MPPDLIPIVAGAAGVGLVGLVFGPKRQKPRTDLPSTRTFDHLPSPGEKETLKRFRKTLEDDPDNIDAYLKLGDLLRERGKASQALRVHRSLTVKSDLSPDEKREILRSLVLDYRAAHRPSQAIATLKELISMDKGNLWAHQTLLDLYEEQRQWEEALETLKHIQRLQKREDRSLQALYKVQAGLELANKGDHRGAEAKFRDALHLDRKCAAAYLYQGDSLRAEGKSKEAVSAWKKLVEQVPDQAHLVLSRLEQGFEELGDRQAMVDLYQGILEKIPSDPHALTAFCNYMSKWGEYDRGIRACERALEVEPGSRSARESLVKLYHLQGEPEKAVEQALALIDRPATQGYRCRNCGYWSKDPLWRCPQCKKWRTFL